MNVYIYNADIWCEECGLDIIENRTNEGQEDTGDSDDFPQFVLDSNRGKSDAPDHCAAGKECINATCYCGENETHSKRLAGVFLENQLTTDGREYVIGKSLDKISSEDTCHGVVDMWVDFYGITMRERMEYAYNHALWATMPNVKPYELMDAIVGIVADAMTFIFAGELEEITFTPTLKTALSQCGLPTTAAELQAAIDDL